MARARATLAQQGTANPKNVSTAQPSPSPSPSAADDEPPSQEELRVQMRAKIGELRDKAAAAMKGDPIHLRGCARTPRRAHHRW